jgi:cytochrome c oxidase subunit 1
MVAGLVMMFGNLVYALRRGKKAPANPWGGATLEWQIETPPHFESFTETPTITRGPYVFSATVEKTNGNGNGKTRGHAATPVKRAGSAARTGRRK